MATHLAQAALPDDWVPADRRWLGLDKRTIAPSLIVLLLIAVMVGVLPAIDRAIDYNRDIAAGDVVDLGSGLTLTPAVGWGFPDGLLVSDDPISGIEAQTNLNAHLVDGAISFQVVTGPFSGTPDELLDNVTKLNETYRNIDNSRFTSDRITATTASGMTGVAHGFVGVNVEGIIAMFVVDGIGIQFVVTGPPGSLGEESTPIYDMINSLDYTSPEGNP